MTVPYKVNMGCGGNIMPFNIFKKYFLIPHKVATKYTTMLRTYNNKTVAHLGRCGVVIENNNKCKNTSFL